MVVSRLKTARKAIKRLSATSEFRLALSLKPGFHIAVRLPAAACDRFLPSSIFHRWQMETFCLQLPAVSVTMPVTR